MKKVYLSLAAIFSLAIASAQSTAALVTVGVAANYTNYKGSLKQSTPGVQFRLGYDHSPTISYSLSYTHSAAIKTPNMVQLQSSNDNSTVASEVGYKFKTFSLLGHFHVIGDNETKGSFYLSTGASYVTVSYEEKITGTYDESKYSPTNLIEKGKENGFVMNFGLGGQYTIGRPIVFGEAGFGLGANKVGNTYVENYIPAHFIFNLGIKLPLADRGGE